MEAKNENSIKLKKITFTGIDKKTDVGELTALYRDYPKAEYGFLAHANHHSLGNRYCSPSILREMKNIALPLSLHICGDLAKRIFQTGDWNEIIAFMQGNFSLFNRIQLNVGWSGILNDKWKLSIPTGISEIIIQQRSAHDMPVYQQYLDNQANISGKYTVLLDASGGRGKYNDKLNTLNLSYVGYAGGLGPNNVADTVLNLEDNENVKSYWIDMETHVRDKRDWFSVKLCRKVCEALGDFVAGE